MVAELDVLVGEIDCASEQLVTALDLSGRLDKALLVGIEHACVPTDPDADRRILKRGKETLEVERPVEAVDESLLAHRLRQAQTTRPAVIGRIGADGIIVVLRCQAVQLDGLRLVKVGGGAPVEQVVVDAGTGLVPQIPHPEAGQGAVKPVDLSHLAVEPRRPGVPDARAEVALVEDGGIVLPRGVAGLGDPPLHGVRAGAGIMVDGSAQQMRSNAHTFVLSKSLCVNNSILLSRAASAASSTVSKYPT